MSVILRLRFSGGFPVDIVCNTNVLTYLLAYLKSN